MTNIFNDIVKFTLELNDIFVENELLILLHSYYNMIVIEYEYGKFILFDNIRINSNYFGNYMNTIFLHDDSIIIQYDLSCNVVNKFETDKFIISYAQIGSDDKIYAVDNENKLYLINLGDNSATYITQIEANTLCENPNKICIINDKVYTIIIKYDHNFAIQVRDTNNGSFIKNIPIARKPIQFINYHDNLIVKYYNNYEIYKDDILIYHFEDIQHRILVF